MDLYGLTCGVRNNPEMCTKLLLSVPGKKMFPERMSVSDNKKTSCRYQELLLINLSRCHGRTLTFGQIKKSAEPEGSPDW